MELPPAPPRTGHTGSVVAYYIVGDRIAANGRCTLYLGRSLAGMHEAEIKVMREEYQEYRFSTGSFANPYMHELRASVELGTSLVVRHVEVGTTPSGSHYLVRERARGEGCEALLARGGGFDLLAAIGITAQIASAVEKLHAIKMANLQLTPANLLLQRTDNEHVWGVRVMDLEGVVPDGTTAELPPARFVLEPQYLAPEIFQGGRITTLTDCHALGSLLYALLAGRAPLVLGSNSVETIAEYHAGGGKVPKEKLRSFLKGLPDEVDMLVRKCLTAQAAERPSTVEQFLRGLHHVLKVYQEANRQVEIPKELWSRVTR